MRASLLIALLFFTAAQLQAELLVVYLSDGKKEQIPVSEIHKISFVSNTSAAARRLHIVSRTDLIVGTGGHHLTLTLNRRSSAQITVYNAFGQVMKSINLSEKKPGIYTINLQSTLTGKHLAYGCYLARAKIGNEVITKKFLIVK